MKKLKVRNVGVKSIVKQETSEANMLLVVIFNTGKMEGGAYSVYYQCRGAFLNKVLNWKAPFNANMLLLIDFIPNKMVFYH